MSATSTLLRFLEDHAGQRIKRKDIEKHIRAMVVRKFAQKGKRRIDDDILDDPLKILADLELLGMIREKSGQIQIRSPFLAFGKASLNTRGMVFVSVKGADPFARDLFIAPQNSAGAITGDEVLVYLRDRKRERFEGEIVEITKRSRSLFRLKIIEKPRRGMALGILLDSNAKVTVCLNLTRVPQDIIKRIKLEQVIITTMKGGKVQLNGSWFLEANFHSFEEDSDMDPDYSRILMKYNYDPVYPAEIELPEITDIDEKSVKDWKSRKDLRKLYTITIDGATSKDFDDAISLEESGKNLTLYVHIADVAHYVKKNSTLDKEAAKRATSVYLADRVVPMLPPLLSENLCSLIADVNRLAFTAEMTINPKTGEITHSHFYKSIIKVDKRYTYDLAEKEIDADAKSGAKKKSILSKMWELAQIQKKSRIKDGRLDLNIPEVQLLPGKDTNSIGEVKIRERLKSSMLIEEFMLSANTAVADFLRKKKAHTLYRIHESMDEAKLDTLNAFFAMYNVPVILKDTKAPSVQKALSAVANHPKAVTIERIFNLILLRSFMQACYRGEPLGHWGLGFKDYCHFTSPIRRYPDLVVHRSLSSILNGEKESYTSGEIDDLGIHTSEQERKAMDAERDINKLKMIRLVESSGKKTFSGFLTGFRSDRVFLEIIEVPVEGVVPAMFLTNDLELIQPDEFSVYVKKLSRPAVLGEVWKLELERIDTEDMKLYFKPLF